MADALTEAHRRAQLLVGALIVRQLRGVWKLLDPQNLDASFDAWLGAVAPIVVNGRQASATLAAGYLSAYRAAELGFTPTAAATVMADPPNLKGLTTSMLVTGPVSVRSALARKVPLAQAMSTAEGRTAASGMRWALNGGRETILKTVKADRRAAGWMRVTSSKACDFCRMLATRGAVYSEDSGAFAAHDGCACSIAPIYQ